MNKENIKNGKSEIPVIALTLGDPAGIGPELIAKLLNRKQINEDVNLVLVGDYWLWEFGQKIANCQIKTENINNLSLVRNRQNLDIPAFISLNTINQKKVILGQANKFCGKSVLDILNLCMDSALNNQIDAICFAPLNKYAMKLGGLNYEDELHHFANYLKVDNYFCEFNTLGNLWTSRISSHIPISDVTKYITQERIIEASKLIYQALLDNNFENPKIAIAALNPHGGDGGTCGREEIEIINPAVKFLQNQKWQTENPFYGPFPADTIFLRAKDYQAIVTMYHDQGQIAIKLLGFSKGVTVQGGLPIPITTPAHGTAYDIAGFGKANEEAIFQALQIAKKMGKNYLIKNSKKK